MKWFERHLNWTAVIITIAGFSLTFFLAMYSQGFYWVERLNLMPTELKSLLIFTVLFTLLAATICMLWVIQKKSRNILLSLFFAFSLSMAPVLFLLLFIQDLFEDYGFARLSIISCCVVVVWLTGLVLLLMLKNRSITTQLEPDLPDKKTNTNKGKSFIITSGVSLILALVLATWSFVIMETGTRPIHSYCNYQSESDSIKPMWDDFRFDLPKSYYNSDWLVDKLLLRMDGETINDNNFEYIQHKVRLFKLVDNEIQVHIYPDTIDERYLKNASLTEKCVHLYFVKYDGIDADYSTGFSFPDKTKVGEIPHESVVIGGYQGELSAFTVLEKSGDKAYFVRMACFEKDGYIWSIMMIEEGASKPNPDFDMVLASFEIPEYITY